MTRDQVQSVHDDIAYMKALAQEGRQAPLVGGRILVTAGLVFGVAAIVHYGIDSGLIDIPPVAYLVLWGSAMLVFFGALIVGIRQADRKPGAQSVGNRAAGAGWMGAGLGIFVMSLAMGVIGWKTQSDTAAMIFPSLIFALYGSAWAVSATMSGQKWQWYLAIGSWIATPLIAFLIGSPLMWLGYAAGLFLFALVPGLILMRQEPAEVV
ncbi:hypothetical protein [Brevundimonas diminuta]|uniref:Uncharacterized protein n=1 Tax=Brevundimonas diminuta TaxID=293 RepID=A0A2X1AD38_BREDI|nr:hypothetical protein [Brevundimonas diminuta]SPU42267.1 Uncharacterised protein [Brevundimonas diminuta]